MIHNHGDRAPLSCDFHVIVSVVTRPAQRKEQIAGRSEEHTSELQSLAYLVCRLLLEKKKRDAELAVRGLLNLKMGGPGVFPPLPAESKVGTKAWPVTVDPAEHIRRSLYILVRRNVLYPLLETFDSPDTNLSWARREVSTTAPQALALLNSAESRASAFFFNDPATTEIYTLSLHDALPIFGCCGGRTRSGTARPRTRSPPSAPFRSPPSSGTGTGIPRSRRACAPRCSASTPPSPTARSEEHTSELQSLAYLVCRLLLEKKKK